MKIFLAGAETFPEVLNEAKAPDVLMSYYYIVQKGVVLDNIVKEKFDYKPNIFLDCGAYTAWTKGVQIDLDKYIRFISDNKENLYVYAQLDDKDNPAKTKENLEIMLKAGLNPLPVYHLTMKDTKYLEYLLERFDYVAIGAIAGEGIDRDKLEKNIRFLVGKAKKYKTRLHIFGMTSLPILVKYPVFSADSSSWLQGGNTGALIFFDKRQRKFVGISYHDKELFRKKKEIEQLGLTYEELIENKNYNARNLLDARSFVEAAKWLTSYYKKRGWEYWEAEKSENNKSEKSKKNGFERNKGKIQEILKKNPQIEQKRIAKLRESMTNFKTGKYAKNLPYYCNDCYVADKCPFYQAPKNPDDKVLCALRDPFKKWFSPTQFDYRDEKKVLRTKNRIMSVLLQRAAMNLWFEILEGGVQDKALTQLFLAILDRLAPAKALIQNNVMNVQEIVHTLPPDKVKLLRKNIPDKVWDELLEGENGNGNKKEEEEK